MSVFTRPIFSLFQFTRSALRLISDNKNALHNPKFIASAKKEYGLKIHKSELSSANISQSEQPNGRFTIQPEWTKIQDFLQNDRLNEAHVQFNIAAAMISSTSGRWINNHQIGIVKDLLQKQILKNQLDKAIQIVETIHNAYKTPSPKILNVLVAVCNTAPSLEIKHVKALEKLLETVEQPYDIRLINTFLTSYRRVGLLESMKKFKEYIVKWDIHPSIVTISSLIGVFQAKESKEIYDLLQVVLDKKLDNPHIAFNKAIHIFSEAERAVDVEKVLQLMEKHEIPRNFVTYAILIRSCRFQLNYEKALQLYKEAESTHPGHDPSIYDAMITMCLKTNRINKVLEIMKDMVAAGFSIDTSLLINILKHFDTTSDPAGAYDFYAHLKENFDYQPTKNVINSLLEIIVPLKSTSAYDQLWADISTFQIVPDIMTYNSSLRNLAKREKVTAMKLLLDKMVNQGIKPDRFSYNSFMSVHSESGDMDQCLEYFDRMIAENIEPDEVSIFFATTACMKARQPGRVIEILEFARNYGDNVLKSSFNHLIKYNASVDESPEKSLHLYDLMKLWNIPVDVVTYTSLLDAYVATQGIDGIDIVRQKMKEENIEPDVYFYGNAINLSSKTRRFDVSMKLLNEMVANGIPPNPRIFNSIISAAAQALQLPQALLFFERMKTARIPPDHITISVLLEAIGQTKSFHMEKGIIDYATQSKIFPHFPGLNKYLESLGSMYGLKRAIETVKRFAQVGFRPHDSTISVLMSLLGENFDIKQFFEVTTLAKKHKRYVPRMQIKVLLKSWEKKNGAFIAPARVGTRTSQVKKKD